MAELRDIEKLPYSWTFTRPCPGIQVPDGQAAVHTGAALEQAHPAHGPVPGLEQVLEPHPHPCPGTHRVSHV
jgi:hypothetical protein